LREEHTSEVFENRVLRRIQYVDVRGRKWCKAGEDCLLRSFVTWTLHQILLVIKLRRMRLPGHGRDEN
jgi:hypothetical protein